MNIKNILIFVLVIILGGLLLSEFGYFKNDDGLYTEETIVMDESEPSVAEVADDDPEVYIQNETTEESKIIPDFQSIKQIKTAWEEIINCCKGDISAQTKRKQIFYEACDEIVLQNTNEDLAANCLWFMPLVITPTEERTSEDSISKKIALGNIYINRHLTYKMPLDDCNDCSPGDLTAKIGMRQADELLKVRMEYSGMRTLEEINDQRKFEISDWLLAEFTVYMISYYQKVDATNEAYNRAKGIKEFRKLGLTAEAINRVEANLKYLTTRKNSKKLSEKIGNLTRFERLEKAVLKMTLKQ